MPNNQTHEHVPDRMPLQKEFLLLAEQIFAHVPIVRDGKGRAMDPGSVEADPVRFEQRMRLAWQLVLVLFCHLIEEEGLMRNSLPIDDRKLFDAIKGLRTIALFHDWQVQHLNLPIQRNALKDMVDMSQHGEGYGGVKFRMWVDKGRIHFDQTLFDLLLHLIGMLQGHKDDEANALAAEMARHK
jgi:hypothetical protein